MTTIKYSRQREAIKEYVSNSKEHPTADNVYMSIRNIYPNISLGTVYRNLNLLAELGEIVKIDCQDGSVRFDGHNEQHYHLICKQCGKVTDLEMESIDHINVIANAGFDGKIESHITYFRGTCPECTIKDK